jgi:hypothetical protein
MLIEQGFKLVVFLLSLSLVANDRVAQSLLRAQREKLAEIWKSI